MMTLDQIRKKIDKVDEKIIELLAERSNLVKQAGVIKKQQQIQPFQPSRWKEVLQSRKKLGKTVGLDETFIENLWILIHEYSIKIQS